MVVPVSPTAGPLVIQGDVARCYAQTPMGALLAAAQISARIMYSDQWQQVVEQQVLPGPGREAFVRKGGGTRPSELPASGGGLGQLAGFKFVTYSPQATVLELVTRFSGGQYMATTLTVRWHGGDWRLELQPDGSPATSPRLVSALEEQGYVPWGGV
jgi:hypothetical protein